MFKPCTYYILFIVVFIYLQSYLILSLHKFNSKITQQVKGTNCVVQQWGSNLYLGLDIPASHGENLYWDQKVCCLNLNATGQIYTISFLFTYIMQAPISCKFNELRATIAL